MHVRRTERILHAGRPARNLESGNRPGRTKHPMTNNRRPLINALLLIAQPLLLNAVSIPATAYIIRSLGATGYGQWVLPTVVIGIVTGLTHLGLRALFIRELAQQPERAAETLAVQLGLRVSLAVVAAIAALLLGVCLGYPAIVLQCLGIAVIGLILVTASTVLGDFLQGLDHLRGFTLINLASGLLLTAASVIVIYLGGGPVELSLAYLIGPLINVFFAGRMVRRLAPIRFLWNLRTYYQLLYDARSVGAQTLLLSVRERIESVLLPNLVGITTFGYFSAGNIPASRLVVIPDGISNAFYAGIARNWVQDKEAAHRQILLVFSVSAAVCFPIAILIWFFADPIATLLFPANAVVCAQVIRITIWSLPLNALEWPMGCALQATGKHDEAAKANMASAVVGTGLALAIVPLFGLQGACWSIVLQPVVLMGFLLPRFIRAFPSLLRRFPLPNILLCSAGMFALLWLSLQMHLPYLVGSIVGICLSVLGYSLGIIASGILPFLSLRHLPILKK
jgi:enterobacterial common antigen flippase